MPRNHHLAKRGFLDLTGRRASIAPMLDFETLSAERRRIAAETIKPVSPEELFKLGEELFVDLDHPWRELYFQFIEENRGEKSYTGDAGDGFHFVYCPSKRRGLWYRLEGTRGAGPLQERGLQGLDAIIAEKS